MWPYENDQSISRLHFTESQYRKALKADFAIDVKTPSRSSIRAGFAILAGGIGSPPHVDTMYDISDCATNAHLAVGYIAQGIKYFWALPPKGGHFKRFLDFFRERSPVAITPEVKECRDTIYKGEVPPAYQGVHSMGWPCVDQWNVFKSTEAFQNLAHFHEVFAGDLYIVVDGSWHAVVNNVNFQPVGAYR